MVKLKLHPLFLIFACAMVYYGYGILFLTYLVVLFVHEWAHAFVAKKLGYGLKSVTLLPYGAALDGSFSNLKPADEIKIAAAGPLINVLMCVLFVAVWWILPESYNFTSDFVFANFVTAAFNLIPAFPLDGGRIMLAALSYKFKRKDAFKAAKITGVLCSLVILALFAVSAFSGKINYTLLTAFVFILSGVFYKNSASVYTRNMYSDKYKKLKRGMEVKITAVSGSTALYKLNSALSGGYYNEIYVLDKDYKLSKILYEEDIENAFLKYPADTELEKVEA